MQSPNRSDSIRRISRGQLATALMLAGSASLNSLSNLANVGGETAGEQPAPATPMSVDPPPVLSSPSTSTTQTANRLTNSMFSDALSNALRGSAARAQNNADEPMGGTNTEGSSIVTPTILDESNNDARQASQQNSLQQYSQQYNSELYTMREMGLHDETSNLHAIVLCNGNVEAAINLVLSGMGDTL